MLLHGGIKMGKFSKIAKQIKKEFTNLALTGEGVVATGLGGVAEQRAKKAHKEYDEYQRELNTERDERAARDAQALGKRKVTRSGKIYSR